MEELRQKVKFFESRLGISKTVNLSIGEFGSSPRALTSENTVRVPSWMLFRHEDIPLHLRVTEFEDPRLTDQNFLNQLAAWMNTKIGDAGLTSICRPVDMGTLQKAMLVIMSNASERVKDFVIGHEVAHLSYFLKREIQEQQEDQVIAWAILSIFMGCLALVLLPIIAEVGWTLIAAGCVVFIYEISCFVGRTLKISSAPYAIEEEKNADLASAEALQNATGGIYYFTVSQMFNQVARTSHPEITYIDSRGNNLEDKKHPPVTERIDYLRAWQLQHSQRA